MDAQARYEAALWCVEQAKADPKQVNIEWAWMVAPVSACCRGSAFSDLVGSTKPTQTRQR